MHVKVTERRVPITLLGIICSAIKAGILAESIAPRHLFLPFSEILRGDLLLIGLLLLLEAAALRFTSRRVRQTIRGVLTVLLLWHAADCYSLTTLNARANISDFTYFAPVVRQLRPTGHDFTIMLAIVIVVGLLYLLSAERQLLDTRRSLALGAAFLLFASADNITARPLGHYSFDSRFVLGQFGAVPTHETPYSADDIRYYRSLPHPNPVERIIGPKHLLMVIIESLSSADSERTSGLANRLPRFDAVSKRGTLFTEFYANYGNSEGGYAALMHGVIPLRFPGSGRSISHSFGPLPSAIGELHQFGVRLAAVTAYSKTFLGHGEFLDAHGFDPLSAPETDPRLQAGREHTPMCCASDRSVYEVALDTEAKLRADGTPSLLFVITLSSHPPPTDPLGISDSEERMWSYVDEQLEYLVSGLDRLDFFSDGLLMITGDHRKMRPISESERVRYGASAIARVPLVMIGPGVLAGKIDTRPFQQSDLLRKLRRAIETDEPLSPHPIYVIPVLPFHVRRNPGTTAFVFDTRDPLLPPADFSVEGRNLIWNSPPPPDAVSIESELHRSRAVHQYYHSTIRESCRASTGTMERGSSAGFVADRFRATEVIDSLERSDMSYIGSEILPKISSRSLTALAPEPGKPFRLRLRAFIDLPEGGDWGFRIATVDHYCLFVASQLLIEDHGGLSELTQAGYANLPRGPHPFELRYFNAGTARSGSLELQWSLPGTETWEPIPPERIFQAVVADDADVHSDELE